jgi:hypothetical protein
MHTRLFRELFVCFICMIAMPTKAAVIYTYTGNAFDSFSSPSSYDSSMMVTVTLELPSKLEPNLNGVDVVPLSFDFNDGVQNISEANATEATFNFSTDATGAITEWFVRAVIDFPFLPPEPNDTSSSINTTKGTFSGNDFGGTVTCLDFDCISSINDFGTVVSNPGAWSVVPIPAAVWLFGSGLLGLIGVARRRKNA